jgi:hypothetical protein
MASTLKVSFECEVREMAYSSILGADRAPVQPSGRDAELLGPSDSSDSGSDALGTDELHGDSDASGTGERGSVDAREDREGADILPDHIVKAGGGEVFPDSDVDAEEFTDLDVDASGASESDEDGESR